MKKKKIKVFIDAEVLTLKHFSGIGHYTASVLKAVDDFLFLDEFSHITVSLGVPMRDAHKIVKYDFQNFGIRKMPITPHLANGLKQLNFLPPIDLIYGKQIYVFPNYSSWPTLFSKSIPIIYDLSFVKYPEFGDTKNMQFLVDQVQRSVERSCRIITISTNSKNEISEHYETSKSKIDIVFPVIEMRNFYKRSPEDISRTKAKYGIFDSYVLYVGNLEPRKNLVSLLCAYEKLPKEIQSRHGLLLIGAKGWKDDGIHKKILQMRMDGLKVIQPIDYVEDEDLPALMSGASAFAYVSIYEGFGIPPVEALACGTRVVTSNNSSLPEACGSAVKYVDATNVDDITRALEESLNSNEFNPQLGYDQAYIYTAASAAKQFLKSIEEA